MTTTDAHFDDAGVLELAAAAAEDAATAATVGPWSFTPAAGGGTMMMPNGGEYDTATVFDGCARSPATG